MNFLGSLTNRIFLASAALAVLSIAVAVYFVSRTTTRHAEAELQRGLIEAGTLVDQQCATLVRTLNVMARLVAELPTLKAAVDTGDPPTVQPLAIDYREQLNAALLVLTSRTGAVLGDAGDMNAAPRAVDAFPEIQNALAGREWSGFWTQANGVVRVVTVPITMGLNSPEIMGTLTVGFRLDNNLAAQFKRATESDIAFAVDGQIRASTLPPGDHVRLASLLKNSAVQSISLEDGEYVALKRPLVPAGAAIDNETAPAVLLLRSRTERLRFLNSIHTGLGIVAIVAVLAATVLSYAVARSITRPIAAVTDAMREMAATGDLTRKIMLTRAASWEDEDATLLATTFNTLTDSIARFQREAAQRERLSALGRLSTVIAHEIRNPLMIIKTSLRTLGSETVSRADIRQALTDVDEEVARLNRVVNDVLDFARPIRFEYALADVNAICADAEQATRGDAPTVAVNLSLDRSIPRFATDAERLRTALVNILMNARHAVTARRGLEGTKGVPEGRTDGDIDVLTAPMKGPMDSGIRITIRDRGVGVKPEDLPRVFDPYFTTKRTGSGLGLAIAKNIIEGMGGSIVLESPPGGGTEIRLDLPADPERRAGLALSDRRAGLASQDPPYMEHRA